jgi:hypothetical protein
MISTESVPIPRNPRSRETNGWFNVMQAEHRAPVARALPHAARRPW